MSTSSAITINSSVLDIRSHSVISIKSQIKSGIYNTIRAIHASHFGLVADKLLVKDDIDAEPCHPERPLIFDDTARPYITALLPEKIRQAWGPVYRPDTVNLMWWDRRNREDLRGNLGDMLSPVIVDYMAGRWEHSLNDRCSELRHLAAIGSLIGNALPFSCVLWGTGYESTYAHHRLSTKRLDVRAVRGPLSAQFLTDRRVLNSPTQVPYGDPAVLLPLFYKPTELSESPKPLAIFHGNDPTPRRHDIGIRSVFTSHWQREIDAIANSSLVVSTSLHGIILAEAYGVSAVMIESPRVKAPTKFADYYLSTGRPDFPVAHSVDEALSLKPAPIPDFSQMRQRLIDSFPIDLWE